MTSETEALFNEVLFLFSETLPEVLKYYKRLNEQLDHEKLERQLAEVRAKRWGYPVPRKRGR